MALLRSFYQIDRKITSKYRTFGQMQSAFLHRCVFCNIYFKYKSSTYILFLIASVTYNILLQSAASIYELAACRHFDLSNYNCTCSISFLPRTTMQTGFQKRAYNLNLFFRITGDEQKHLHFVQFSMK